LEFRKAVEHEANDLAFEYNTQLANYYDSQLPIKGIDLFMTDLTV
jgi:hypothetical protein